MNPLGLMTTSPRLTDDSVSSQTPSKKRLQPIFQGSIDFSEKGYRLFGKSLGTFLKLGRHSVRIGCLLRSDWVGTQFPKIAYPVLTGLIAIHRLDGLLYFMK